MHISSRSSSRSSSSSSSRSIDDSDDGKKRMSKNELKAMYSYASQAFSTMSKMMMMNKEQQIFHQEHDSIISTNNKKIYGDNDYNNTNNMNNNSTKEMSNNDDDLNMINSRSFKGDDTILTTINGFQLLLIEMLGIGNYQDCYLISKLLLNYRYYHLMIELNNRDDDDNDGDSNRDDIVDHIDDDRRRDHKHTCSHMSSEGNTEIATKYLQVLNKGSVGLGIYKGQSLDEVKMGLDPSNSGCIDDTDKIALASIYMR